MKVFQRKDLCAACVTLLSASLCLGGIARAQNVAPQARIVEAVQNDKVVTLRGNVHPMARPANDRGSLPEQQPVTRMHVLLQRSADQEAALQRLLADQQDPNSSKFHAWLTPQEFGKQFGPAESDLRAVKAWLNSQGFTSLRVNNGRTLIEFSGTSSQIRNAFHTEMHRLSINNEEHFANMQEPKIPAALAPVVGGIAGLHNFRPKPLLHRLGKFRRDASTGQITPLFTFTDVNGTFYGVGSADFAKIYNVPSTFDGTGQSIAIVGQSNINLQDVRDFRTIFGLPTNDPQIILNGADPGLVSGDEGESDLDVEWAGAIAPKAKIILVTSQFTETDGGGGVDASAEYIVDTVQRSDGRHGFRSGQSPNDILEPYKRELTGIRKRIHPGNNVERFVCECRHSSEPDRMRQRHRDKHNRSAEHCRRQRRTQQHLHENAGAVANRIR